MRPGSAPGTGSGCWAVVPAAGVGRRMGGDVPKQYLSLQGKAVIEHAVERLAEHPRISGVVVVLSSNDRWWSSLGSAQRGGVLRAQGGAERCHSVLNGLKALAGRAHGGDWVLVHDAVRPCVRTADIDRLILEAGRHPVGGLLGLPVRDTMKRTGPEGDVRETVEREGLWHALTPQMFRLDALTEAIEHTLARGAVVTDEAQAMELTGAHPRMVEGHPDNIKITRREDLALAELYLASQGRGS